jgi:hypothetical protein
MGASSESEPEAIKIDKDLKKVSQKFEEDRSKI